MRSQLFRTVAPLALAATLVLPAAALALPSHGTAQARPAVERPSNLWAALRASLQSVWTKAGSALDPDGGHGTSAGASAAATSPGGSDAGSALDPDGGHRP